MKFHLILLRIVFYCLLLPLRGAAMESYTPVTADPLLEPWRWRQEEALADLSVLCMAEAADGSLWFGNVGSLAQYDGVTVTQIPFDEALLSKIVHHKEVPWANALTVLPDGNPLVLIGESLVLRSGEQWDVIIEEVGSSVFTAGLKQAEDGTIWLIVPGSLWRISKDLTEASVVMTASSPGFLGSFCLDAEGNVWVAEKMNPLHSRLVRIPVEEGRPKPPAEWREYPAPFETDATEIWISAGRDGLIWYADNSTQTSLSSFNPRRNNWVQRDETSPRMRSFSLSMGRDGTLWMGGEKIIFRTPPKGKPSLYSSDQLQLPQVPLSMLETRNQRLWVLGRIGYVYSVDIGTREWMTLEKLHFQCETSNGTEWFLAKQKGVAVAHDSLSGKWRQYDLLDGLIDTINVITASSRNLIWAAGSHEGRAAIAVFDGKRWERFLHPEFAEWIEPNAVLEAADGTMWFGAGGARLADVPRAGGALQYDVDDLGRVHLKKHHAPSSFPYYITSFAQASDQTLWIGSTFIYRYDASTQTAIKQPELQGLNTVDMAFDQNQTLWVAKEHAGVYQQRNDSWKLFSTRDGLAGVSLSDLLMLRDGTLLASSGSGISRFDGSVWTTYASPEWWTMSSRWSGMHESANGSVWFNFSEKEAPAAQMAINQTERFYTIRHRAETTAPDTHITEYMERVAQPGNSHVAWSALDPWSCTPRQALQFSWRLNGGEWSAFSHETSRTFLKLHSGRHLLEVRARDRAFNIDPTPARVEFDVIPPIWKQTWFIVLISALVGLIVLLIWILIRNREKHLLEQQESREAHLKEMDRMKTGFFTNISHELRTPITVILGRLEMLLSTETDEKRKNTLSTLVRNAHRISTLVTQLLDFRKIEDGTIAVETTHGDLVPVVKTWVEALLPLAEQAQISFTLESAEECRGRFDFDKLQKIFTNLISNSIKYTKAGGAVRVCLIMDVDDCRAETVEDLSAVRLEGQDPFHPCKNKTPGRRLIFVVEDTGVGISQEHQAHIFDRFYRVPESSMAEGAGIGLNLTKELVDLLGGEIQVESPIHPDVERPGTRFTVRLPIGEVTGARDQGTGVRGQETEGESGEYLRLLSPLCPSGEKTADEELPLILVVEDDEDIRSFIVEGLGTAYRIEAARNGEIGLRIAKELVPDLIITDVMMPVMDGVALCRALKTSLETSHIPVVMLTAKASLEHQMEGLKTGADDYVTKPFHMEFLQIRIANLLASRRRLREQFCREYAVMLSKVPENTPDKEFLEKAMHVLEENYSEWEFKPDNFAAALHMSPRTLQRKLSAVADRTPMGFINEFRMMRAAELLTGTSHNVTEITFMVGFDEPTNFTRTFRKHYNMSPSQYRTTHPATS